MVDLQGQNILICSRLKKERVIIFNFFDNNESGMIYSAKDIKDCESILDDEKIDYLIIDCSDQLIHKPSQLFDLTHNYSELKIVLLIDHEMEMSDDLYYQFQIASDSTLFSPMSHLEIELKLTQLYSKNVVIKDAPQPEVRVINNNSDQSDELWSIFFNDSMHAKVIVKAGNQEVIKINEAALELLNEKQSNVVGYSWKQLDAQESHEKYTQYIKELNSSDEISFVINHQRGEISQNLIANYQMSVLEGEIVYLGILTAENLLGVSSGVYNQLAEINQINIDLPRFDEILDGIRSSLDFTFLFFSEYHQFQLSNPAVSGNEEVVTRLFEKSMADIQSIVRACEDVNIDRKNYRMSEYINILTDNNLQSFCAYPVVFQNKIYGSIFAGGQNQVDDWQTISVLLSALASQCKFHLFQKSVVEQRKMEGLKDKLTGLPNRNSMTKKLAQLIEGGIDADKYVSLMIIDFDKINYFNKSLGIELTNQIIVNTSQIIIHTIESKGLIYRLSGDEFLVLLNPHDDKSLVESLTIELVKKLNKPILLSNGEDIKINFNIGISIFPDDGQTVSSMLKNADLAMYDAKLAGNNNYIVFKHSETGQALKQKIEMEENLRKAIDEGHIKVFYQPKINAVTEDITGFEALVRWIDPEIGMINPGHFIPLAEEIGLISEIGEIVTKQSCKMIVEWQKKYGLALSCSINLSVVQLMDEKLPKTLEEIINSTGVHPHFIDFEITETMSLDDVPNLVESLNEIVSIGCTLSIDDFGTGHSSLDYVKRIPAQYIKIDQSFVKNIGLNPEDEAILDATINIAKRLNREIVAEGVETEEQREYLLDRECEFFQGFLFARPMPEEDVELLLQERISLMGAD
jgi:diguanylate cyclase (GGDEF)-like protein